MKQARQNEFAKEFLSEAQKKGTVKSLGSVVGLPDKEDWENICRMIDLFRKESVKRYGFDILVDAIATARKETEQYGGKYEKIAKGFNVVNKDSHMRYHFELPESFVEYITRAYPLMFTDKAHYHWFCRNFGSLRIPERF
jgi:hypothetical protein